MYKLAIIDDEALIQLGVNSMVHYKELSLQPCPFVNTGAAAEKLLTEERPDIVLLDISIPDRNGLELIEDLRKTLPDYHPVYIILTNHDSFSYAQTALRLGVLDFLTKIEISESVLNETMKKAIRLLDENEKQEQREENNGGSQMVMETFFSKLLNGFYTDCDEATFSEVCRGLRIEAKHYGSVYYLLPMEDSAANDLQLAIHATDLINDCMKKFFSCFTCLWEANGIAVLYRSDDGEEAILEKTRKAVDYTRQMLTRYMNRSFRAGIGEVVSSVSLLPEAFSRSRTLSASATAEQPVVWFSGPKMEKAPEDDDFHICFYREELIHAFNACDVESVRGIFQDILEKYIRNENSLHKIASVCFSLLHFCVSFFSHSNGLDSELYEQKVDPVETIRKIRHTKQAEDWILELQERICSRLEEQLMHNQNWLVPSIQEYIEKHSGERLSLNEVAEHFELSPGYISTLFTKYGSNSFSECVRTAKLNRAKELLGQQMRVQDVSDLLGYSDPYYFSRIFKKYVGVSPREYAMRFRDGKA